MCISRWSVADRKNTRTNLLLPLADNHSLNIYWIFYLTRRMWEIRHNITTWHPEVQRSHLCILGSKCIHISYIYIYINWWQIFPLVSYTISSLFVTKSHHRRLSASFTPSHFQPLISFVQKHIKIPQFTLSFYCLALSPLGIFKSKQLWVLSKRKSQARFRTRNLK